MRLENSINLLKNIYNKIIYFFLNAISFFISDFEVYNDSNGWFMTFKYKNRIFKFYSLFTPLKPQDKFKDLKKNLSKLNRMDFDFIPKIKIRKLYFSTEFVNNGVHFIEYVKNINNSNLKIKVFLEVLKKIEELNNSGFYHNDLKPKNILIKENRIYFIDLEAITDYQGKKYIDYTKFLDRSIYFLTSKEFLLLINKFNNQNLKEFLLNNYYKDFNIQNLLNGFNFIEYEKQIYSNEEDIDIIIENKKQLNLLIDKIKFSGLDFIVFYCCSNDIKIFIYNQRKFISLDVHLKMGLNKLYFIYKKLTQSYFDFFITGPDGSGKTTIINELDIELKKVFPFVYVTKRHSDRFFRDFHIISNKIIQKIINKLLCDYFFCILKKSLFIHISRLYTKSMIFLYDRSFLDQFIYKRRFQIKYKAFNILYTRKTTFLLKVDKKEILKRKKELSEIEIDNYYKDFENNYNDYIVIKNNNKSKAIYQIMSNIRYIILQGYK